MSKVNVELIRAIYDAFAAGDVPGVFGRMSPDIVWNEAEDFPYADGNPYVPSPMSRPARDPPPYRPPLANSRT